MIFVKAFEGSKYKVKDCTNEPFVGINVTNDDDPASPSALIKQKKRFIVLDHFISHHNITSENTKFYAPFYYLTPHREVKIKRIFD